VQILLGRGLYWSVSRKFMASQNRKNEKHFVWKTTYIYDLTLLCVHPAVLLSIK
jgi:hypothetical protein